ncbi:MAG: 3-deoxy-manno-octulosonate cytidylyltransferase [Gemmatimonadales bacterium]
MPLLGVIPARLGSSRLPEKPLRTLAGDPLILWVVRRVAEFGLCDQLLVATDSQTIADVVVQAGYDATLTGGHHRSGTERVAEVAARPEMRRFDTILNVQGDEPFVSRAALAGAVDQVRAGYSLGTAAVPLDPRDASDPSNVKVQIDSSGRALAFSRSPIAARPGCAVLQHVGVYAYTPPALARWVAGPPVEAETRERLEQLRPMQQGMTFGVARLAEAAVPGIDTPEDLVRAEAFLMARERA